MSDRKRLKTGEMNSNDEVDANTKKKRVHCNECPASYTTRNGLLLHKQKKHGDAPPKTKNYICMVCSDAFTSKRLLDAHLTEKHEIILKSETLEFESEEAFVKWKEETEKRDLSSFVTTRGSIKKKNGASVSDYVCHRSGYYKGRGSNKRNLKIGGSNKLGKVCPARIKVVREPHRIVVNYHSTHVGHTNDVGRLPLLPSEKSMLAGKMFEGVPMDDILQEIQSAFNKNDRLRLINKRELHNIARSYKIDRCIEFNEDDATSVAVLVTTLRLQSDNPVILFKPCGSEEETFGVVLKDDDFVLAIMNDVQRAVLELYWDRTVYIESTPGVTQYNYQLTMLVVLDNDGEGFPVAFLLANKQDEATFQLFFNSIKSRLAAGVNLEPTCFISDGAPAFYNAWVSVFKPVEHQLLSAWHVRRAWDDKLMAIPEEKRATLKMELYACHSETDVVTFEKQMSSCLAAWRLDDATKSFADYFQKHYLNRKQLWAYCYRAGLPASKTNVVLENWHREFKINRDLKVKPGCRLDKSIHIIMTCIRKKMMGGLISIPKGKLTGQLSNLCHRHEVSSSMEWGYVLELDTLKSWAIPSSRTVAGECDSVLFYYVNLNDPACKCEIRCLHCNLCIHALKCSCVDNKVCHNMCKHVHLVGRNVNMLVVETNMESERSATEMNVISKESSKQVTGTLEELKARLTKRAEMLIGVIQKISSQSEYQVFNDAFNSFEASIHSK